MNPDVTQPNAPKGILFAAFWGLVVALVLVGVPLAFGVDPLYLIVPLWVIVQVIRFVDDRWNRGKSPSQPVAR